ncbi:MAG: carbon-nitrogen hydrolase family protein [Ktedonobacteraceae bacterium]
MVDQIKTSFKIAAIQATPVFLDRSATVEKACELIAIAGHEGARLVVFPEAFIPTYPHWVWEIPAGEEEMLGGLYAALLENAVTIPSEATERLCRAAKLANVYVVMGMSERNTEASGASMYNTILYIDAHGEILGKHRKLVPTGGERLVWAQGDGSTLRVYDTSLGKIGGLICWENYMPLARYAMYAWGTQIYLAPTWDRGQTWQATLRHIAKEGRVYVIGCSIVMHKNTIPDQFAYIQKFYADAHEWINVGDSAIIDPWGQYIAGPVRKKEEILYAEIDIQQMYGSKWMFDVAGHYARPDVFELIVHTDARQMLQARADSDMQTPGSEMQ